MAISINEIAKGLALLVQEEIYLVTEVHHVKPGKGSAFVRVRLKNLKTDLILEKTFRSSDRLEDVFLEEKKLQYLYRTGNSFHFMDQVSFEERTMDLDKLGEGAQFLQENMEVTVLLYKNQIQKVSIPTFIIANIAQTEPGFKGDTSKGTTKPAMIDTGATVQVPLFINKGDRIKIDTRSGEYVERVQK